MKQFARFIRFRKYHSLIVSKDTLITRVVLLIPRQIELINKNLETMSEFSFRWLLVALVSVVCISKEINADIGSYDIIIRQLIQNSMNSCDFFLKISCIRN